MNPTNLKPFQKQIQNRLAMGMHNLPPPFPEVMDTTPPPQHAAEESDTPRTDALLISLHNCRMFDRAAALAQHANTLERELATLRPSPVATALRALNAAASDRSLLLLISRWAEEYPEIREPVLASLRKALLEADAALSAPAAGVSDGELLERLDASKSIIPGHWVEGGYWVDPVAEWAFSHRVKNGTYAIPKELEQLTLRAAMTAPANQPESKV